MKYAFITYVNDNKHFDVMELDETNYQRALKRLVTTGTLIYCTIDATNRVREFDFGLHSISNISWFDTKEELISTHFVELL